MKTARKHFETFPEPYRTQAIENTQEDALEEKYVIAQAALCLSFIWINSPQGHNHWHKFHDTLC